MRPLSDFDELVLRSITTGRKDAMAIFNILPLERSGDKISRSLQKLKRRGWAVIVRNRGGVTWWRSTKAADQRES